MSGEVTAANPRDELPNHLQALRAFALSLTRNTAVADDMVQDTIVKAWSNIEKFEAGTNMRAWLFTILRNTFYSNRRKLGREVADPDGALAANLSVKPSHDGRLQLADFRKAFDQLPLSQREALILVGANGFSYEEAAQMCGAASGTMKSRVNRGRNQLIELLGLSDDDALELTDPATMAVITRQNGPGR